MRLPVVVCSLKITNSLTDDVGVNFEGVCFQNCSDLALEKIIIQDGKNYWDLETYRKS